MIPVNKLFSDYLMSGSLFDECYFCLKFIRINSFIYLGRTGSLSPCTHSAVAGSGGHSLPAGLRLLTAVASVAVDHGPGAQAAAFSARGLSNHSSRALEPRLGRWGA